MAALRKYERALASLKNLEKFSNSMDKNTSYNLIVTNLNKLDDIRKDCSDALDNASTLTNEVIEEHWTSFDESHSLIKSKLLDARDSLVDPNATTTVKDLEGSITAVLDSQKNFFDKFNSTSVNENTGIHNNSCDLKVPRLNIQSFSGGEDDYKKWPPFYNMFKVSVHDNASIKPVHKFQLLNSFIKGEAYDLISHLLVTEENYLVAWDKLCLRYNKKRNIANSYIKQFLNLSQISVVTNTNLRKFADVADEMIRGLDALGESFQSRDPWLIFILLSKLDDETNRKWADISSDIDQDKSIIEFLSFLTKRCDVVEACQIHTKPSSSKSKLSIKSFVSNVPTVKHTSCPHCNGNHQLYKCFKFISFNSDERRKLASTLNLCFNCLKPNHTTIKCFSNAVCQICKRKHHTLLHSHNNTDSSSTNNNQPQLSTHLSIHDPDSNQSSYSPLSNSQSPNYHILPCTQPTQTHHPISPTSSTQNFMIKNHGQGLLPTVQAYARDTSGHLQLVRALLDSASMCSFVTESCVQKLGLHRSHACLSVTSLSCQKAGTTRGQVEIELIPIHNYDKPIIVDALIMNKITSNLPTSDIDISSWETLKHLNLGDSTFHRSNRVDILIGVKHFYKIQCPEPIINITQDVIAQKTRFGYVIAGQTLANLQNITLSTVVHDHSNEIHEILQNFWRIEEIPEYKCESLEEKAIEDHYITNTVKNNDGRISVKLPFNSKVAELGDSYNVALRRLFSIEAKFKRDPKFKENYVQFMNEYIQLGHMEEIGNLPAKDNQTNKLFYLPHHAVIKEESLTTKTRVVFDGSCKTSSGLSLNDCLMSGPNIQPKLITILLNFRTHNIAFTADIAKMYRQIWVSSEDRDYQRILWREDTSTGVKIYQLKTVTYGTTAAPFLAIRSLVKIANESSILNADAKKRMLQDFYVDDLLSGSHNVEHAIEMKNQITIALQKHGMPLRKWTSNSSKFLQSISSDNKGSPSIEIQDETMTCSVKTLGLNWKPSSDEFYFKVHINDTPSTTKRQIASIAAKIFDPLGWLTPVTVSIKIFLQALWINKLGWDDEISEGILGEWNRIYTSLTALSLVRVPRCLNICNEDRNNLVEIHGFSDASELAYGAAVYLRVLNTDKPIGINLVAAKSKVAPLKQVSLARLELCGAVLLTELINWIRETLCLEAKIYAWTDSAIVLAWLSDFPRKWATFVANRTSKILESLPRHHWHHIKSEFNPADLASRGIAPSELSSSKIWWHGPNWLLRDAVDWPVSNINKVQIEDSELEVKANKQITLHSNIQLNLFNKLFIEISSLHKILKSICIFNRFLQFLQKKSPEVSFITAKEIQRSQLLCIKWAQHEAFASEIKSLMSTTTASNSYDEAKLTVKRGLSSRSTILSLTPFVDDEGVLRVGGRLEYADISYAAKHPIILPKEHILSKKIVEDYHEKFQHTGTSTLMSIIRQKFWIIGLRNLVKHVNRNCVRCVRIKAKTSTQLMGNLPQERLTPTRPFLHTGVDFAGPLSIRATTGRGRVQITKGYIAIFICYSSKAIHLELVSNMTTEAFIASLKRFTSRRGIPAVIHCDNGTNFVGAEKSLRKSMHQFINCYSKSVMDFASEFQINFQFNPPSGPHFGALWESNIKSVKTHLKRTTKDALLTFEEMSTLLSQIEAILNSRPISALTDDIDDMNYLTPSHFLIGANISAIPEPNYEHLKDTYLSRWQNIQKRIQGFWKSWSMNYITSLQERHKWKYASDNIEIGDLVLIKDDSVPPSRWAMGRVLAVKPGYDGLVRVVNLRTQSGELKRPIVKLVKLPVV